MQQIVNKEFNFAPFFLSTALIFFAVAKAMPVKLALYKEKNEAKYTTHYLQIAALVEENEMLFKLKEMEYAEKIADKINSISLSGGYQLKKIFSTSK